MVKNEPHREEMSLKAMILILKEILGKAKQLVELMKTGDGNLIRPFLRENAFLLTYPLPIEHFKDYIKLPVKHLNILEIYFELC